VLTLIWACQTSSTASITVILILETKKLKHVEVQQWQQSQSGVGLKLKSRFPQESWNLTFTCVTSWYQFSYKMLFVWIFNVGGTNKFLSKKYKLAFEQRRVTERTTTFQIFWDGPNHEPMCPCCSKQKLIGRSKFDSQEWGGSCCWKSIRPFHGPHKKFHYSRILTWLKTQGISHFQKLIIFLTARIVWLWLKIGQTCFFPFWWGSGRGVGGLN
jgi:hypothetical protein